jgi:hypothetical protein
MDNTYRSTECVHYHMHMLPFSSALNSMDHISIVESNIDKLNQIYFPYNILPFFVFCYTITEEECML